MSEAIKDESSAPAKKSIVRLILLIVTFILAIAGSVGATLFFTGALSKKTAGGAEAELAAHADQPGDKADPHDKAGAPNKGGAAGKGAKKDLPAKKAIPEGSQIKFEKSYMDLDEKKPMMANIANSRKVVQISISLMTQYDDRVFKNVEKHRAALRSVTLDVLRQITEVEITRPDFRVQLAQRIRDQINVELERIAGFGGIEEIFFTDFVYQ